MVYGANHRADGQLGEIGPLRPLYCTDKYIIGTSLGWCEPGSSVNLIPGINKWFVDTLRKFIRTRFDLSCMQVLTRSDGL